MYRFMMFLLSLFSFKSCGNERVWVNHTLLAGPSLLNATKRRDWRVGTIFTQGTSQYHTVGSMVMDWKGRFCTVTKQGTLGALRRLSVRKTRQHVIGRALAMGQSLRFRWMTTVFKYKMWRFRMKKRTTTFLKKTLTVDHLFFWLFMVLPACMGFWVIIYHLIFGGE